MFLFGTKELFFLKDVTSPAKGYIRLVGDPAFGAF
jgi:hypothetical protein